MRTLYGIVAAVLLVAPAAAAAQDPAVMAEGGRAWAANCTRCHNARPSLERTDAQWQTIMAHMRARANLRRTETRAVTLFLQATNSSVAEASEPAENVQPQDPSGEAADKRRGGSQPEPLARLTKRQRQWLLAALRQYPLP